MRLWTILLMAVLAISGNVAHARAVVDNITVPNFASPIKITHSVPCKVKDLKNTGVPNVVWITPKGHVFDACEVVDIPPTLDHRYIRVPTQLALVQAHLNRHVLGSVVVYRFHTTPTQESVAVFDVHSLGEYKARISGAGEDKPVHRWIVRPGGVGYLVVASVDHGSHWFGIWQPT